MIAINERLKIKEDFEIIQKSLNIHESQLKEPLAVKSIRKI